MDLQNNTAGNSNNNNGTLNTNNGTNTGSGLPGSGVNLSGLKSSVLRQQTEEERKRIQTELDKEQKRRESANKNPAALVNTLKGIVVLALVAFLIYGGISIFEKYGNSLKKFIKSGISLKNSVAELKILESDFVVFNNDVRLKIKTTPGIDKTTLAVNNNSYTGNLISTDDTGNKYWEFLIENLKKGKYDYKCYVKQSASGKFNFVTGNITVK